MHDETYIRLGSFFGVLVIMALWEVVSPKRSLTVSKVGRWVNNLGIIFIDNIVVYLLAPAAAVVIALKAQQNGWGFLYYFHVPKVPAVIIGVLFLDMMIYLQHLMFHAVPLLWRLHMVHHADLDIDVSTALRFHPIEILLSLIVKIAGIVVIGASVEAVLIFELLLNGTAMFNHGNVNIPEMPALRQWIKEESKLGNPALEVKVVVHDVRLDQRAVDVEENGRLSGIGYGRRH